MGDRIDYKEEQDEMYKPVIKVMGLGGGGGNAIKHMMESGLRGVEFIVANTDKQVLTSSPAPVQLLLGPNCTSGWGAGGDPQKGYKAANESREDIRAALEGADMVFLTAGMGGGTGTGAIAVAGEVARELGAITISIVTTPFGFEGTMRQRKADEGLRLLSPNTDTLISIPNDRLLEFFGEQSIEISFRIADDVLRQAVQGITELITATGLINVDLADIRRMMKTGGGALMTIGYGTGEDKARKALDQALRPKLLGDVSLAYASGLIANFSGAPEDMIFHEMTDAFKYIHELANSEEIDVVIGFTEDETLKGRLQVTLLITGIGATSMEEAIHGFSVDTKANKRYSEEDDQEEVLVGQESSKRIQVVLQENERVGLNPDNLDLPAFMRRAKGFSSSSI
ncbi:MAG: cell division protein FtsZ [Anaerolineales bacterium]|nr:cell division protein FtsZ [Anaerolineales bacterium]